MAAVAGGCLFVGGVAFNVPRAREDAGRCLFDRRAGNATPRRVSGNDNNNYPYVRRICIGIRDAVCGPIYIARTALSLAELGIGKHGGCDWVELVVAAVEAMATLLQGRIAAAG